ncbi:MAG: ClbS/DfsB family four-helix bundle protein, partial [Saezia sp.]
MMARATTKPDLIKGANEQFDKMWKLIDGMTEDEQNASFDFGNSFVQKEAHWKRDKNLRDVLVHLYEWHQLLLDWIRSNKNGNSKSFIPAPYNWKTYGQMNVVFWEKHQDTTLDNAKKIAKESHADVIEMIEQFNNDELFVKGSFSW